MTNSHYISLKAYDGFDNLIIGCENVYIESASGQIGT